MRFRLADLFSVSNYFDSWLTSNMALVFLGKSKVRFLPGAVVEMVPGVFCVTP
ncbi:hypothetical protein AXFE_22740 [Acidithrix ferrooxidans]|uniref:Uncharacterized protein n=1 Tax=Acidithrix ferrooxidans TaxID=1280514 RepID=A0A0D8HG20_9ACTN|nr:hypothetical protein AXFE_22740 [Acidithrix ferrooxidans]